MATILVGSFDLAASVESPTSAHRQSLLPDPQNLILETDPNSRIDARSQFVVEMCHEHFHWKAPMYFFFSISILISQLAFAAERNRQNGVTVSYESLGSARIARFKNSNSYQVRVEFSYQGTRVHGSGEASGSGAVFVPASFSATYGGQGLSITSVRITKVMRMD
jgi:hypothetical protein